MKLYYPPRVCSLSPHFVAREAGIPLELVKVYDSATDGRARFTAHSSFNDPNTPAGAPPRQSIEARTSLSLRPARSCSAKGA
ncbi:MAG TPA: hypothetical protein VK138_02160 [Acidiferrobacterales bacterium]|nr:hypothetical protein [Acidiferrobacterales bacterium]